MNNDELKKKILEIFEKAIGDWYEKDDGLFAEGYTPEEGDNRLKAFMADALIAAGIGDVKETKFECDHYWRMWQGALVELEREEHRAKVAERALQYACKSILKDRNDTERRVRAYFKAYIDRAEKELAEERKDE